MHIGERRIIVQCNTNPHGVPSVGVSMLTMPALRQGRLLLYFPFSHLQIHVAMIPAKMESKKEMIISIKTPPPCRQFGESNANIIP